MLSSASRFWLGAAVSTVVLILALLRVEPDQLGPHLAAADYWLVVGAALLQLTVIGAIAIRWGLLFRVLPPLGRRFRALLVAQLVNLLIPVRLGMLVRAYLLGLEGKQNKIAVFTTVVAEKVFDSLAFVVLFALRLSGYSAMTSGGPFRPSRTAYSTAFLWPSRWYSTSRATASSLASSEFGRASWRDSG